MSTTRIREALKAFRDNKPVARDIWFEQAMAEVVAIEKAARFIANVDAGANITPELARAAAEANDTLERIAMESK